MTQARVDLWMLCCVAFVVCIVLHQLPSTAVGSCDVFVLIRFKFSLGSFLKLHVGRSV